MIDRRRFLATTAATAGLAALPGCRQLEHLGIPITVLRPGMAAGHALRGGAPLPAARREIRTGVAILGSGIAGLSAAWRLAKEGHDDYLLVEGPEPFGNAAGGRFDSPSGPLAFPRGAHYLPLPSLESATVREILFEQGVIEADPFAARPRFAETALVHAPDERLLFGGQTVVGERRQCAGLVEPDRAAVARRADLAGQRSGARRDAVAGVRGDVRQPCRGGWRRWRRCSYR